MLARLVLVFLASALAGCASTLAPLNQPLGLYDARAGYRESALPDRNGGDLFLSVSFSGGGTRAAALAYGVLRKLEQTPVRIAGRERRLLDAVDTISAVSGGSYTAAYYGLFGDRLFDDFEQRFLKRDVQGEIVQALLSPSSLFRITSPYFARSDVTAEYLDRTLFAHKTFAELRTAIVESGRPYIRINATDMGRVSRFEFSQEQFDLLCSDLGPLRVASAVVASSAVPVIFTPITLRNFAGTCGYGEPAWITAALQSRASSYRRYYLARDLHSYLDSDRRPYIHLIDGGLSDNLGLRASLDRVTLVGPTELAIASERTHVRRIVQIVVNAQARVDFPSFDQRAEVPSLSAIAFTVSNATDRYSIETLALLRSSLDSAVIALKKIRRENGVADPDDVKAYLIEVSFDALADPQQRAYFHGLPTSFRLAPEEVDRLRDVAAQILEASPTFRALLEDLR